jgi:hypothetical protein
LVYAAGVCLVAVHGSAYRREVLSVPA